MATVSGIARPYALAAFDYAHQHEQLSAWKAFLENAAQIASHADVKKLFTNPQCSSEKIGEFFIDLLRPSLDTERKNFLQLLTQHHRLAFLPDIAEAFNAYYAVLEKTSKVRVITAVEMQKDFTDKLAATLSKHIKKEVTLNCEVDAEIIGGAIIHIGDRVIDGSLRGKLSRLHKSLSA